MNSLEGLLGHLNIVHGDSTIMTIIIMIITEPTICHIFISSAKSSYNGIYNSTFFFTHVSINKILNINTNRTKTQN